MAPLGKMGVARSGWPNQTRVDHVGGPATPWGQRAKKKKNVKGSLALKGDPQEPRGWLVTPHRFSIILKKKLKLLKKN